jgi:glutaredoxin
MTTIYVKPDCPYCEAALRELEGRGEPYSVVDVLADPGGRKILAQLTDGTLVTPVVVEDNGAVRYTFGGG